MYTPGSTASHRPQHILFDPDINEHFSSFYLGPSERIPFVNKQVIRAIDSLFLGWFVPLVEAAAQCIGLL